MSERNETSEMDRLQSVVGEWADLTFPDRMGPSIVAHLKREMAELAMAVTPAQVEWEAADVAMLLLDLAYFEGFSLWAAILTKFAIVQNRRWQEPDAEGVVEHVREGEE